ncbi:precorrin-6A synthase (deacetylating) [Sphingomonas adhaesiva]|uniref:precorrin-6A synthase (deacetylating) n=1 Tax=Sphingomonas adhaesiva TaxID=28212 RepID=UPI002FFA735D
MIDLHLIGIGTGNPDHLTRQAGAAMNAADLILLPRKGTARSDLIDVRRMLCAVALTRPVRIVEFDLPVRDAQRDYLSGVAEWHAAVAAAWAAQIARHLPGGGRLALLVWGDPSLYDSTLRIAERLRGDGMAMRIHVVPGITSLQALTAAHATPLNELGAPVVITTGRRLRDGWPGGADRVAVMLDGDCTFATLPPAGVRIWWGAYLGMPNQALASGPLADVAASIVERRAALRREHGWIMDTYLLSRAA